MNKTMFGGKLEIIGSKSAVNAIGRAITMGVSVGKLDEWTDATKTARKASPVKTIVPRSGYKLQVTCAAYGKLSALDETLIGTPDYMGIAYFWNYEFRHTLRDSTAAERCKVHDAFLAAGLAMDGDTAKHRAIINKIFKGRNTGL